MKHIFLNLKRFDVPVELGGVNRLAPVAEWGRAIVAGTQQGLTGYDPAEAEFVDFFPEAHLIPAAAARTADSRVELGCQGVFRADTAVGGNFGAFTTNRPAHAAAALGCGWVLIGHCEERNDKAGILAEAGVTDTAAVNRLLNQEVKAAQAAGLKVLYCIGEKSEEQEAWQQVLGDQLAIGLDGTDKSRVVIAYEPIWSIGPGKTPADKPYIEKIARFVKERTGGLDVVYGGGLKADTAAMLAMLTENTNGQTTYEVQKGDTFMALAFDNDMTMAEMEELNPGVDINKLYIGQILNIKEEIPFLGVQTVDSLTYHEEIACEVREVEDDSMYQGESKVLDAGIPGEALVTADVTYVNGVEKERNVTSTTVLREATEKVIAVGTKERPTWYPTGNYIWPVYGRITSRFGYRSIFGSYSYHSGLDIAVPYGTSVKASDGGTVTFAGYKGSYGYLVIINHGNGEQTYYGHNSSLLVSAGDKVYQGQTIAKAGSTGRSTGSHCHFEIRINGTAVNPAAYLN